MGETSMCGLGVPITQVRPLQYGMKPGEGGEGGWALRQGLALLLPHSGEAFSEFRNCEFELGLLGGYKVIFVKVRE